MRVCVVTSSRIDPRKPRALGFVRALVRAGHHVHVVAISDHSLSGRTPLEGAVGGLEELGVTTTEVTYQPRRAGMAKAVLSTVAGRATSDVALYQDPALRDDVRRAVEACRPDVLHADRSRVLPLIEGVGAPVVVDLTDPRSLFFDHYRAQVRRRPDRLALQELVRAGLDLRAARREERELPRRHLVLVASEAGRDVMAAAGAPDAGVVVVPNPVERAERADPTPRDRGGAAPVVALTGNLSYPPNVLAAVDFGRDVWPTVAGALAGTTLQLIGATPHRALDALAARTDVEVRANVADMAAALAAVDVAVAPHEVCGGFPNRVVDTVYKAGRPIVVSDVIGRMAPAELGTLLPVARNPREWVERIRDCIEGGDAVAATVRELQDRLEARCGIDRVADQLVDAYARAGATPG